MAVCSRRGVHRPADSAVSRQMSGSQSLACVWALVALFRRRAPSSRRMSSCHRVVVKSRLLGRLSIECKVSRVLVHWSWWWRRFDATLWVRRYLLVLKSRAMSACCDPPERGQVASTLNGVRGGFGTSRSAPAPRLPLTCTLGSTNYTTILYSALQ